MAHRFRWINFGFVRIISSRFCARRWLAQRHLNDDGDGLLVTLITFGTTLYSKPQISDINVGRGEGGVTDQSTLLRRKGWIVGLGSGRKFQML
jgi:hypothetical protein